jgi:hypothetical protein
MGYITETNVSNGIHIDKAIYILHNFILQQGFHELKELTENEMTEPDDKNCAQSYYRFSERAERDRYVYSFSMVLDLFHGKTIICYQVLTREISFLK